MVATVVVLGYAITFLIEEPLGVSPSAR